MAPNVTVHFWDANDINGTPILEITDEDTFFKGLTIQPDLYSVGGWQLTLARAWGFQLFGSGAVQPEVFVRFLVHAYSDTTYYYGGQLDKRNLIVVDREEIGAEQLVIGGRGPKAYMDRSALGIEQRAGLGFNLDLDNGVWRWNEAATAGRILDAVVDEDNARPNPSLPDLTSNFDDTNDSDGNAWTNEVTPGNGEYETPVGSSLLDVIWDLEDSSEMFTTVHLGTVASPQYQLNAFQSFGDDNTGINPGAGVCILREGLNIANDSLTVEGVAIRKASHVIVEGKDGVWVTEVRPTWSPGDYVKWDKIEYSRSSSEAILHRAGLRWLQRQSNGDQQITVELLPGHDEDNGYYFPRPDGVLWLGNTITLDTVADGSVHSPLDYNNADALVTGWELTLGEAGDTSSPTKTARSWTVKVNLNGERAGFAQSPNQTSAATGNNPCQCPPLCHATVAGDPDSVAKEYYADHSSGDLILWDGIIADTDGPNFGPSGRGWWFKSSSPDQWQETWAAAAGSTYVVTGSIGCSSNGYLKLGFFTDAAGTDPPTGPAIEEHQLSPLQPNHEHSPEWTAFAAGPFTAPSGSVSAALGRSVGADFGDIVITLLGEAGSDPYNGTEHGAARCDHIHPAEDIVFTPGGTIVAEDVQAAIEEVAEDAAAALADAMTTVVWWKQPVRVATTTNGTMSTAFDDGSTVDGVTLATGDRILLKNQTATEDNGVYVVQASGAPDRSSDCDSAYQFAGSAVIVQEGTANADKMYVCTTNNPITVGSTSIVWAQLSGGSGATFGTPAIVLGTAAAAGSIDEVIRRDSTIVAFDATAPVTQAFSDSAATGSAAVAARRDHKHGMPADPSTASIAKSFLDAKGDLISATANDTPAILSVGGNGKVLAADSAEATGLKWVDVGDVPTGDIVQLYSGAGSIRIPGLRADARKNGFLGGGITEEYETGTEGVTWDTNPSVAHNSNSTVPSGLYGEHVFGAAGSIYGLRAWTPGTASLVAVAEVGVALSTTGVNSSIGVMAAATGTTPTSAVAVSVSLGQTGGYAVVAASLATTTWTQRGSTWNNTGPVRYVKITRAASSGDFQYWWSADGYIWTLITTHTFSLTIAQVGYRWASSAALTARFSSDFLRTNV